MKTPNASRLKITSLQAAVGEPNHQRIGYALLVCILVLGGIGSGRAATATKLGTGTELTDAASWSGGSGPGFPTLADVATWDSTSLGAGLTLAGNSSWGGINVLASSPAIAITGAGTLTIGDSGITNDTAAGDMSFTNAITLGANQTWNIGAGRTLITAGVVGGTSRTLTKDGLGMLVKTNTGDVNGGAIITAGTLKGKACGSTGTVTMNGGTWDLAGVTRQINILTGTGGQVINNGTAITLAVGNGGGSGSYAGVIADGTGVLNFKKQGAGTNILTGTNTFTGIITIDAGSGPLSIGGAGQLGSGSYAGNIALSGGTFSYDSSANQTLSGVISGVGSLVLNGPGTLRITNSGNSYSGPTIINSSTLVGKPGSVNSAVLTMNGGTFDLNGNTVQLVSLNGVAGAQIVNNGGGAFTLHVGVNSPATPGAFAGVIADGTGALSFTTRQTNGTLFTLSGANTFSGVTTITAGGFLKLAHSQAIQNSTLASAVGVVFDSSVSSHVFIIGQMNVGDMVLQDNAANNVALMVGNNNKSNTYSGIFSGGGSLTKIGIGRLILSGPNTYTGATVVSNGNLWIDGGIVSSTTVKTNATLGGSGGIGGAVTVEAGGTLYPGNSGVGTLTASSNLTLNAASTNYFTVTTSGGVSNNVVVGARLSPNSSVIRVNTDGTVLDPGTYTNLFTYSTTNGTTFTATPVFDTPQTGNTAAIVDDGSGHINLVITLASLASPNAYLTGITLTPVVAFTPSFVSNTLSGYTATENYGVPFTVTVTNGDASATNMLTYNGGSPVFLTNGVASGALSMNVNPAVTNTLSVAVTAQDGATVKTYAVSVVQIPSQAAFKLTNSVSGGTNLVLTWPLDHTGYRLLTQTNNLQKGVSGNTNDWGTVPGSSTATNTATVTIDRNWTTTTNEYFRLVYP